MTRQPCSNDSMTDRPFPLQTVSKNRVVENRIRPKLVKFALNGLVGSLSKPQVSVLNSQ